MKHYQLKTELNGNRMGLQRFSGCGLLLTTALLSVGGGCAPQLDGSSELGSGRSLGSVAIVHDGVLSCFSADRLCQLSSAALVGNKLVMASNTSAADENSSSVFETPVSNLVKHDEVLPRSVSPHRSAVLKSTERFEDFASGPQGKHLFMVTGFDLHTPSGGSEAYNRLLAWDLKTNKYILAKSPETLGAATGMALAGSEAGFGSKDPLEAVGVDVPDTPPSSLGEVKSGDGTLTDVPASSESIRPLLVDALGGWQHFKIEGLAAVPGGKLYFGVSKVGAESQKMGNRLTIVEADYKITGSEFLVSNFSVFQNFAQPADVEQNLYLTGLDFDRSSKRLLMTASYEAKKGQASSNSGSFLFVVKGNSLELVRDEKKQPIHFPNRASAVVTASSGEIVVLHNDGVRKSGFESTRARTGLDEEESAEADSEGIGSFDRNQKDVHADTPIYGLAGQEVGKEVVAAQKKKEQASRKRNLNQAFYTVLKPK